MVGVTFSESFANPVLDRKPHMVSGSAFFQHVGGQPIFTPNSTFLSKTITEADTPQAAIPLDYSLTDDLNLIRGSKSVLSSNIETTSFDLYVCVRVKSSDLIAGAPDVYVPIAVACWSVNLSGTVINSPRNNYPWGGVGAGVTKPASWSTPAAGIQPVTTGIIADNILEDAKWT